MTETSISFDLSLADPTLSKLEHDLEELDDRLKDIYRQAMIKDTPIVHSIVAHLNPSAAECRMLSKVFNRLAELLVVRDDMANKIALLKGMTDHKDWLYDKVGDPSRDLNAWLDKTTHDSNEFLNESDPK